MRKRQTTIERFNKFVIRNPIGCWDWRGSINNSGYAVLAPPVDDRKAGTLAHRWSFVLFKGAIPKGMLICHTCDNRRCTNPDHLRVGTPRDNAIDMVARSTTWCIPPVLAGPSNSKAKYTSEDVRKLCVMRDSGMTFQKISDTTGIPFGSVATLIYRRENKHWG